MANIYDELKKRMGSKDDEAMDQFIKRRLIPINGKITDETAEGVIPLLSRFDLISNDPIKLLISSGGGNTDQAGYIIDAIHGMNSPVDALVIRRAASAALDIMLSCRERKALPNSTFYIHFGECGFKVTCDSDAVEDRDLAVLKKKLVGSKINRDKLYSRRLGKSVEEIHWLCKLGHKYNLDYSAEEALELGLIDKIVTDFKFFEALAVPT